MSLQTRLKRVRLARVVLFIVATLVAAMLTPIQQAAATSSCVKPYAPSTMPALNESPDPHIGVIGKLPPTPADKKDKPWEGADVIKAGLYRPGKDLIIMGGIFKSYIHAGRTYSRTNVVEFNAATGTPTSFAPKVDGEVLGMALSCTGADLYLVGNFHHVYDVTRHVNVVRNYAAKVNLSTGAVLGWNPDPSSVVNDVSMNRNHLVLSGWFMKLGDTPRPVIASVDQTTGKPTNWLHLSLSGHDPVGPLAVTKMVPNPAGTKAVVIGNFNTANGHTHRRMLMLNLSDSAATLARWNTKWTASHNDANSGTDCSKKFARPELDIKWAPNGTRWVSISTGGGHAGSICDTATKWSSDTNNTSAAPIDRQQTGGDTLSAGVCTNQACYLSGHNRWANNPPIYPLKTQNPCDDTVKPYHLQKGHQGYNCQSPTALIRPGLMMVSLSTMKATGWDPGRSMQEAMHNVMFFTKHGMCLGSDGDTVGGDNIPVQERNDIACWHTK